MQENSRYAVGIDVGTTTIRCVVAHLDGSTGTPTVVGVGKVPTKGMRKGVVANLEGPAHAIDEALGEAERMSGYQVDAATLSINGSHILSTKVDGMIAVGAADHEIGQEDIHRIEEVATVGKIPANRIVLDVIPHSYSLDGQDGIKAPLGMVGTRLEIKAHVVSALAPHMTNLQKSADLAKVASHATMPAVMAAARAVLSEAQVENGVAVIDLGGATTSVAVYEEGDLQYVGIIPVGGVNITNDLAIGLKVDPEIAEKVKVTYASAVVRAEVEGVSIKDGSEVLTFTSKEIDEIVEARLEEVFEAIAKEFKKAGKTAQLPSGIVLTGGGARMKNIAEYAKQELGLAARIGKASGYGGVAEGIEKPDFAAAVGLMLLDSEGVSLPSAHSSFDPKHNIKQAKGVLSRFLGKFKP